MTLDLFAVRPVPILLATVAQAILGAAWFTAFAKPWAAAVFPGRSKDEIAAGPKWPYVVAVLGGLLTAYALNVLMVAAGATDITAATLLTLLLWAGFVGISFATSYAFQSRPGAQLAIDAGYHLVRFLAMAAILSLWPA